MDVADARAWRFQPSLRSDEDKVVCPNCGHAYPLKEWTETEVYCELCGDHAAMVCPNWNQCDGYFDHVYAEMFRVVPE